MKTLATTTPQGWSATRSICTHDADGLIDAECGQDAVVVVLSGRKVAVWALPGVEA